MNSEAAQDWPRDIFDALAAQDVRQVAYVPDSGHTELLVRCAAARAMRMVLLTTEEEGIALLAGAWLGGERGVLLTQSSGIGNCLNMFSLASVCRFPLLVLVTMRGEAGEFNPWQLPMGRNAGELLRLAGLRVTRVDEAEQVGPAVAAAGRTAFAEPAGAAVLIAQRLVGVKSFDG
ncbi:MAG: phosphonopyruvate decarboxylase, partial [Proteobacteria bacterium]|nr:phosphonopyruvate decarboxylase [Pseudomonadota bacterium]